MNRVQSALLVLFVCALGSFVNSQDSPPNIVLILADDLGYNDISLHGNMVVRTPNIDRIGAEGVRFTRGHTTNATCSPSRAGLMTGRYQQRFGYEFVVVPPQFAMALAGGGHLLQKIPAEKQVPMEEMGIPTSEITIAESLKKAGYQTGIIGKWHMGSALRFQPKNHGFDFFTGTLNGAALFDEENDPQVVNAKLPWDGIDKFLWRMLNNQLTRDDKPYVAEEYMTTFFGKEAVQFIDDRKENPFFLYLAFNAPHTPLQAPKDVYDRLGHIADHKTRVYYAMIESMDESIGMVLDKLESLGIDDNTIVIFSSDNGAAPYTRIPHTNSPFRGSKANYFQGGVVVPYLIRWPAVIKAGTVMDTPVSLLDVFPTVANAAGAQLPQDRPIDGVNLLPLIRGETKDKPHQALVWRSGSYKAVLYGDYRMQVDELQQKIVLYNVKVDVGERTNLVQNMPEKVAELKAILEKTESGFVEPLWQTPIYTRVPDDLWPVEVPKDAQFMYFPV